MSENTRPMTDMEVADIRDSIGYYRVPGNKYRMQKKFDRLLSERVADKLEIKRLQAGPQKTKDGVLIVLGKTRVYCPKRYSSGALTGIPYAVTLGIDCKSQPHFRIAWDNGNGPIRGDGQWAADELYSTRKAAETGSEVSDETGSRSSAMSLEHYVGTWIITKVPIPSDRRGMTIAAGTRLRVLEMVGTQHFNLAWPEGQRAASQIHFSRLKTGQHTAAEAETKQP